MKKHNRLGNDNITKLLFEFSIPAIVAGMIAALYTVVDRIFIGQFVGDLEFSGVSATFPIMIFYMAFAALIGIGASASISISLGRGDKKKSEKILANAFTCYNILGFFIILFNYIFLDQILYIFGVTKDTLPYAKIFMLILIPTCYMTFLTYGFAGVIRAEGNPKVAMNVNIIGAVINIVLDALFIIVFKMGVPGAAWATLIANFVAMLFVFHHFLYSKKAVLRIRKKYFKLNTKIIRSIIKIGISPFILQISLCIVGLTANNMIKKYGTDLDFGIFGILNTYLTVIFAVLLGISQGAQPIFGYNYGAKNYKRVREALIKSMTAGTVVSLIFFIITLLFSKQLVMIFIKNPVMIDLASGALVKFLFSLPVYGIIVIGVEFFQVSGKANVSSILFFIRHIILALSGLILMPVFIGIDGVWYSRTVPDYLYFSIVIIVLAKWFGENSRLIKESPLSS